MHAVLSFCLSWTAERMSFFERLRLDIRLTGDIASLSRLCAQLRCVLEISVRLSYARRNGSVLKTQRALLAQACLTTIMCKNVYIIHVQYIFRIYIFSI